MDDLSGLDWSAKASGAKPKMPPMNTPSYPSLRPTPSPLASGRNTPLSTQGSGSGVPKPAAPKPAQDSFSNLMNFGPSKANQNLTLAERQTQLEAEKRKKEEERRKQTEAQFGNGQQWDTLGSRSYTASPSLPQPMASNGNKNNDDDDLFAAFNKDTKVDSSSHYPPPESRKATPANGTQLDLSNPSAWNSGAGTNGGRKSLAVEDDDPFGLNEMKPRTPPAPTQSTNDDDDFLGDLARPVNEVRMKQKQQQQKQSPRREPGKPIEGDESSSSEDERPAPRASGSRQTKAKNDPFDRAVAQLVDYGFSPEDARRGLVESGSGGNVQAAANWLLDDAHRKSKAKAEGGRSSPASSSQPERRDNGTGARSDADLAKSAAAVGNSLFKTANSLWRTGQKKIQKTVADFQQEGGDPGQPKWMRDAQAGRTEEAQAAEIKGTDEAMMLESGGRPTPVRSNSRQNAEPRPAAQPSRGTSPGLSSGGQSRASPVPRWQQQSTPPATDARTRLNRLAADDDSFAMHVSANRRKKAAPPPEPKSQEPEPDLLLNTSAPKPSQSLPQRPAQRDTPPPARRPQATPASSRQATPQPARQIPPITPAALQASTKHRLEGTAHFKKGDYATAHSSYSSSLASVPSTHPLMILLLTNRALTALKTGEPKQAVADADEALKLIGPGNGKGETVAVKGETGQDENRNMKDIFGKALSRKAEALEQMEKWADAGAVWHQCVEAGVGGPTAVKGRQRCQEALTPKPKSTPKTAARPRPKPSATASLAPQKSSEAVTRLREANVAAAKEDDEKFALSEAVDARVSAWRDGKRDNLRALLGSMETVLWEDSGWKKVGLHELVMANKVKIAYMKAIAKTHPDKLPQDANTEVRLIAGLVFSTLNDSWEKFKTENGM